MPNPPYWYNQQAFRELPGIAPISRGIEAYLLTYSPDLNEKDILWQFLIAPSRLQFSRSAKYNENTAFADKVSDRQYANTSGSTLTINNLEFHTWIYQKSMRPLVEGVMALMEAKEDTFAPPILSFVMGNRRFGPCVLTDVNWDEFAWLQGEQAGINMSLTLAQIPDPGLRGDAKITESTNQELDETVDGPKPRNPLTDRQRKDASDAAKAYLVENQAKFNSVVAEAIKSSAYFLETDKESGEVKMLDREKKLIGIVGLYNGQEFSDKTSTIPLKE